MAKTAKVSVDYILPLYMNGLSGRMLRLPPPKGKSREILLVYGTHASLERMFGAAEYINRYGGVTMPDLPGVGGMDSFYKIGEKPTTDNFADYLAAFVKLRYRNRRVTIAGLSFGFVVVTRMLQKYPEIAKKVDLLISFAGFAHYKDFKWRRLSLILCKYTASFFSFRPVAAFGQHIVLRGPFIRLAYKLVEDKQGKMRDVDEKQRRERVEFEIELWQKNDLRTYMYTAVSMLKVNLCNIHVDLKVNHVAVDEDRYFDHLLVEQHMRTIFKDFELSVPADKFHGPAVIAKADEVAKSIPPRIKNLLREEP